MNCNAGEVAVGGSFSAAATDIYTFAPVGANNGWSFTAHNASTSSTSSTLYAECLKAAHAVTMSFSASTVVAAQGSGSAQASCPAGSLLTGGGYSHDSVSVTMFDFHPLSPTWEISISTFFNNSAVQLTTYAVCLSFNG